MKERRDYREMAYISSNQPNIPYIASEWTEFSPALAFLIFWIPVVSTVRPFSDIRIRTKWNL